MLTTSENNGDYYMPINMKDSGIEWVGKIPKDWDAAKIAALYSLRNTKVSDEDYPPLSVTMQGILPQLDTAAKTNDHDNRKLIKKGDFAINSRSDRRGSCGISKYDGSVSLINTVLKPNRTMNSRYYNWLFHTPLFSDEFYKWGHGIVDDLWTTNWQDMKKITVPYPSPEIQEKIATYLDRKCSEIDTLRADIEKEIATLEEYKKSVITEAVTKGLNPNVEMKESNLKYLISFIRSGDAVSAEEEGDYIVYGGGKPIGKTKKYNTEHCLIVGRVGANCGCVTVAEGKVWATDNALIVNTNYDLHYLGYVLNSTDLRRGDESTAQPLLTSGKIKNT